MLQSKKFYKKKSYSHPSGNMVEKDSIYQNFIEALDYEVSEIKRSSSERTIDLTNGKLEEKTTDYHIYAFYNSTNHNIKDDTNISLKVGSRELDGTIISSADKIIKIAIEDNLGPVIGFASVEIDNSFLTLKLKDRWDELMPEPPKESFNLQIVEKVLGRKKQDKIKKEKVSVKKHDLNTEQYESIQVSSENEVSFIWGPPGTGKTYTLARVIENFYLEDKKILLLSNTNMAVDLMLKSLCSRLKDINNKDFENGSVIRFQKVIDKDLMNQYGEFIDIDLAVARLGKEITDKKKDLEKELSIIRSKYIPAVDTIRTFDEKDLIKQEIKNIENQIINFNTSKKKIESNIKANKKKVIHLNEELSISEKSGEGVIGRFFSGKRSPEKISNELNLLKYNLESLENELASYQNKDELNNRFSEYERKLLNITNKLKGKKRIDSEKIVKKFEPKIAEIEIEISKLSEELNNLKDEVLKNCKIIAATAAQTYLKADKFRMYDVVVLDESSMLSLPLISYVSGLAKERVIISGDFRQLPPIVQTKDEVARKYLETNIFKESGIENSISNQKKPNNLIQLKTQYRMDNDICKLINHRFYNGSLKQGKGAGKNINKAYPTILKNTLMLVDTTEERPFVNLKPKTFSRYNIVNAITIRNLCFHLYKEGFIKNINDIGVVTPYTAQAQLISRICEEMEMKEVDVGTVHRFQGNEKDIIIFDISDSYGMYYPSNLIKGENISDPSTNLLNVAVSRARSHLIVVGNIEYLNEKLSPNSFVRQILYEMQSSGSILKSKDIISLGPTQNIIPITEFERKGFDYKADATDFFDESTFDDAFMEDMRNAKDFIIIFSAFATPKRIAYWSDMFRQKIDEGVKIKCFTRDPANQPGDDENIRKAIINLIKMGVKVDLRHQIHEKNILIDGSIFWHGSLNPLSHTGNTEEEMLRIFSKEISLQKAKFEIFRRTGIKDNDSPYKFLIEQQNPTCPECNSITIYHHKSKFNSREGWYSCDHCKWTASSWKAEQTNKNNPSGRKKSEPRKFDAPEDDNQVELEERKCPECSKILKLKKNRWGKNFYGCDWPRCKYGEPV